MRATPAQAAWIAGQDAARQIADAAMIGSSCAGVEFPRDVRHNTALEWLARLPAA